MEGSGIAGKYGGEVVTDKRVVVPEGMLKAVRAAIFTGFTSAASEPQIVAALEAALLWQRENVSVPTHQQMRDWCDKNGVDYHASFFPHVFQCIADFQRCMYDTPEQEVPDEIRDLYFGGLHEGNEVTNLVRTRVLEAYHRGQKSK